MNNALKASSGVASAVTSEDYSFSKVDARALKGAIPFQNAYGVNELLNWAMEDLPERSTGDFKYVLTVFGYSRTSVRMSMPRIQVS